MHWGLNKKVRFRRAATRDKNVLERKQRCCECKCTFYRPDSATPDEQRGVRSRSTTPRLEPFLTYVRVIRHRVAAESPRFIQKGMRGTRAQLSRSWNRRRIIRCLRSIPSARKVKNLTPFGAVPKAATSRDARARRRRRDRSAAIIAGAMDAGDGGSRLSETG